MNIISLFCGCGGMDLGFKEANFNILWANDNNKKIQKTYEKNHISTKLVIQDITTLNINDIPDCDGIIGGPPCQSWSVAGNNKGLEDKRGQLFYEYLRILKYKKPKFFVVENVKGILSKKHKKEFDRIIQSFEDCGYNVYYKLLNAINYKIPQIRERVIIIGIRKDIIINEKELFPLNQKEIITLKDSIYDIRNEKDMELYSGSFSPRYLSRNRKKEWNEFAFTIQASGRQQQLHPDSCKMIKISRDQFIFENNNYRRLSVHECARIQTFPDSFKFIGSIEEKYQMIGNAVPVNLAYYIAKNIQFVLGGK